MAKQENKPKQENKDFVNPFDIGVTYDQVIEAMGNKTVKEYCEGTDLTDEQIEGLEIELNNYKQNNTK